MKIVCERAVLLLVLLFWSSCAKNDRVTAEQNIFDRIPGIESIQIHAFVDGVNHEYSASGDRIRIVRQVFAAPLIASEPMRKREIIGTIQITARAETIEWTIFYLDENKVGILLPSGKTFVGFDRHKLVSLLRSSHSPEAQ